MAILAHIPLPQDEFIRAIELILNSTFFTFDNTIYRQTFGSPMGSPLSPVIADLILCDLEERALEQIPFPIPIYYRYVDDILIAAPRDSFNEILSTFNSFHERLQFTLDLNEEKNCVNFLDVTIISQDNHLKFDWYYKPTYSGRYLHFTSQHPVCHKRGVVYSLIDRMFLLSQDLRSMKKI